MKRDILEYFNTIDLDKSIGLTLKIRNRKIRDEDERITSDSHIRTFFSILNTKIFKNSYRRYKKQLNRLSVSEYGNDIGYHYHLTIEKPDHLSKNDLISLIEDIWMNKIDHSTGLHIHRKIDYGWMEYILKSRSKENLPDSIDWINSYIS